MQRFQRFGNLALKNKRLSVSVIILLLLFATAIWDVALIIDDYINSNTYTLVKLESVNESIPFLKNEFITLSFLSDVAFSKLGKDIFSFPYDYLTSDELANEVFRSGTNASSVYYHGQNWTYDQRIAASFIMRTLEAKDIIKINQIITPNNETDSRNFSHFDDILNNATTVKRLIDLWLETQGIMIKMFNQEKQPVLLRYFFGPKAYVYIPVATILTRKQTSVPFSTIIFGDISYISSLSNKNNTIDFTMTLDLTDGSTYDFNIISSSLTSMNVLISNIGVFKKGLSEKCSNQDEIPLRFKADDCFSHVLFRIVSKICHCIPFTFRNFFDADQTLPFCTFDTYEKCLEKAQKVLIDQPCLPSCTYTKNLYSVTQSILPVGNDMCDNGEFPTCSNNQVTFECKDFYYAVYEEQVQFSLSQLFSQVGGDLGLYTGISLLGIWQFLVFTYSVYQRNRKPNSSSNETSTVTMKKTLSTLLVHYLEDAVETTEIGDNVQATGELSNLQVISQMNQLEKTLSSTAQAVQKIEIQHQQFQQQFQKQMDIQQQQLLQQQQFQKRMDEMLRLTNSMHNKLNALQTIGSDLTVSDL